MPRKPQPRFCRRRNEWLLNYKGRRYYRDTREEAAGLLKLLEAQEVDSSIVIPPRRETRKVERGTVTVEDLVVKFLEAKQNELAPKTLEGFEDLGALLAAALGANFPASYLTAAEVKRHILKQYREREVNGKVMPYSETTRHTIWARIRQMLIWASDPEEGGLLIENPLTGKNPFRKYNRERVLTDDEWDQLMTYLDGEADGQNFRDLIEFISLTGCRVNEAINVKTDYVQANGCQVVFPPGKNKGRRERKRVIEIPEMLRSMVLRRLEEQDEYLFTNSRDVQWTSSAINSRIARMTTPKKGRTRKDGVVVHFGQQALPFKFSLTSLRHTWCTRFLEAGNSIAEASELMGHSSPRMVQEVYSHLEQDRKRLRAKAGDGGFKRRPDASES